LEKEEKMELTAQEAREYVNRIGPRLGYDYTYTPIFPEGRKDVAVVVHSAEDGSSYGYDVVYLVWKEADGTIRHKEIANSRATKNYIHIKSITVEGDKVTVKFSSGDTYSGKLWEAAEMRSIKTGATEDSVSTSFEAKVKLAMQKVVEAHCWKHPLYKPTRICESVVDVKRQIAAFILFEQIDTDRLTPYDEGWLGDQFRYSLWKIEGDNDPVQIYEDHAYIRPRSKSELTGTRGRDCSLRNLRLEGDVIKVTHFRGNRVEEQQPEELIFEL